MHYFFGKALIILIWHTKYADFKLGVQYPLRPPFHALLANSTLRPPFRMFQFLKLFGDFGLDLWSRTDHMVHALNHKSMPKGQKGVPWKAVKHEILVGTFNFAYEYREQRVTVQSHRLRKAPERKDDTTTGLNRRRRYQHHVWYLTIYLLLRVTGTNCVLLSACSIETSPIWHWIKIRESNSSVTHNEVARDKRCSKKLWYREMNYFIRPI